MAPKSKDDGGGGGGGGSGGGNDSDSSSADGEQIRISLVLDPSVRDESLKVPSDPIAVPSSVRRKGLSAVVNHLLDRRVPKDEDAMDEDGGGDEDSDDSDSDEEKLPAVAFDFLVNGRLLRTGVEAAARREGLSLEKAVRVGYFPASRKPEERGDGEETPDWITSMCYRSRSLLRRISSGEGGEGGGGGGGGGGWLCTGGADGSIRAFVAAGTDGGFGPSALAMAHSGPVKCLSSVASIGGGASPLLVASGSMDQTLLTHALVESDDDDDGVSKKGLELRPHAFYAGGHFASLSSVEMTRVGGSDGNATTMMASGDWDGGLCLWRVPDASIIGEDNEEEEEAAEGRSKKRRGAKSSSSSSSSAAASRREVEPLSTFRAHNSSVSGISFSHSSSTALLTSSWDHSVKVWDLQRLDCVLTLNGSRVVTAMGRCSNSDVVATGHPDCAVRLWDLRVSMSSKNDKGGSGGKASGTVSDNTLKPSHKAWVSAVQWSPTNPYTLVTSSHDGTVKTWDIRSSLPLHTVRAHPRGEKGLCLAYGDGCVYGGGTDCVVKRFAC